MQLLLSSTHKIGIILLIVLIKYSDIYLYMIVTVLSDLYIIPFDY
jgi:hypothetical protein